MLKDKIKKTLLIKLHAVERQQYDITDAIVSKGLREFLEFDYENFRNELLLYCKKMQVAPYTYKYSASREKPCLYASIYAVMLEGLLGVLSNRNQKEILEWGDYLNSFQNPEDGLYYDPNLVGDSYDHVGIWHEGWGKHHLMGHMIIALARLGVKPKYQLKYLEDFYDQKYLVRWMNSFDFSNDVWTTSNYFMNLYTVLEYVRDYMDEIHAGESIKTMIEWIKDRQNPETGMWHSKKWQDINLKGKYNVVCAAYHFYPLFEFEGIEIPNGNRIIEHILPLQNRWGGWTLENGNSGACEDIDAIEPLLRCANMRPELRPQIENAIKRSIIWQLSCRNDDRGFSFYLRSAQEYGGHILTTSLRDESSMFATWFRTLCLAYEMRFLGIKNGFEIGRYPGYEIN